MAKKKRRSDVSNTNNNLLIFEEYERVFTVHPFSILFLYVSFDIITKKPRIKNRLRHIYTHRLVDGSTSHVCYLSYYLPTKCLVSLAFQTSFIETFFPRFCVFSSPLHRVEADFWKSFDLLHRSSLHLSLSWIICFRVNVHLKPQFK